MTDEQEERPDYAERLRRCEAAALASHIRGDQSRGSYAILAMEDFYRTVMGNEFEKDPIIQEALQRAAIGAQKGHITHSGVYQAIDVYSESYKEALKEATLGEVFEYLGESHKVPKAIRGLFEKYKSKMLEDVENEKERKIIGGEIKNLLNLKLEKRYLDIVERATQEAEKGLEAIVNSR